MKALLLTLGLVLLTDLAAIGQAVSVEIVLDQTQYLQGEALILKVRISNFSGQNLRLGKDNQWLTFSVEDAQHMSVSKLGPVPVAGEFTLEPSTTGTKKVDLAPYFDLARVGRYYLSATVSLPQWGGIIESKPVSFDITRGSSLWEREFGMPTAGKPADSVPEVRKYALVQTLHSKVIELYLRLTDAREEKIFRVYPLGQIVTFSSLEPQLDQFNNLHVLFQTAGRIFTYCVINPNGLLIARESYAPGAGRPALRPGKEGRITVVGGIRRFLATDLPPPADPTPSSNAKSEQP